MNNSRKFSARLLDIKGIDDRGQFFNSLTELQEVQERNKHGWYSANMTWWESGYGGLNDDEAMIGDCDGEEDANRGLEFLNRVLAIRPGLKLGTALDCGAGVGRISKYVLLRKCSGTVTLLEGNLHWSLRSRAYLGRKRASRCSFVHGQLQEMHHHLELDSFDIIWFQWCLQYLTDLDVIAVLIAARNCLRKNGIIIVKENIPTAVTTGSVRTDRFQMDTPEGPEGRFDITRPELHHKYLFQQANLDILMMEVGVETISFALECRSS